jgi:sodium borate transporter 11
MPTWLGRELLADVRRRLPWYWSDWADGVARGSRMNLISTVVFMYFICLLPVVAFGSLNEINTKGFFSVKKVIISQGIGGICFSILGGQPLAVLLSTAPLALVISVVYRISEDHDIPFDAMYAWVGIFNTIFLLIFVFGNVSNLFFKYTSLFTEETFAVFISIAFSVDAFQPLKTEFSRDYAEQPAKPLLWIILMLGTLLFGVWLWGFRKSVLLNARARQLIVDFALPVAVITMAFVGAVLFKDIELESFNYNAAVSAEVPSLRISAPGMGLAALLGLSLSILFFMDQNISAALLQTPGNGLKKGSYYHLDLFVVALINLVFSLTGLPWVHAALPHCAMHGRALADTELRVDPRTGHVFAVVLRVRETRLSGLISHVCILMSVWLLPSPLRLLPVPVLYGLFLYLASTGLSGNGFWARIQLLVTEKSNYPSSSLVRHVPADVIRRFTLTQLASLGVVSLFGFFPNPYVQMVLPVILVLLMVVRHAYLRPVFGTHLAHLDASDTYHPELAPTPGESALTPLIDEQRVQSAAGGQEAGADRTDSAEVEFV